MFVCYSLTGPGATWPPPSKHLHWLSVLYSIHCKVLLLVFLSLPPSLHIQSSPSLPAPAHLLSTPHCRICAVDDRLFSICWPTPLECEASGSVPVHICCFFKGATANMSLWTCCPHTSCCHQLLPPPVTRSFFLQLLLTFV